MINIYLCVSNTLIRHNHLISGFSKMYPVFNMNIFQSIMITSLPVGVFFSSLPCRSMSTGEHLGGGARGGELLGGVGGRAPGGVLHGLHKEGRRHREVLQHHRHHLPLHLHLRLHLPHHRLPLQPGWLQPLRPRPQLHHQ